MKILTQLKRSGRYFRKPRLKISEIVESCRKLSKERGTKTVDVFLSPKQENACMDAVLIFCRPRRWRLLSKELKSPFGFHWESWRVDKKLTINFVGHDGLAASGRGLVFILDWSSIYTETLAGQVEPALVLKSPEKHSVFGCVKKFVAR